MAEKQKTIAGDISLKGKGLHSGKEVTLTIKPAESGFGYQFKRTDLEKKPIVRALAENVINTSRGTTIRENGAEVMTIEHLCAALYGTGIDNALIELNGPEVPIIDGSSKYFVEAIRKVGSVEQDLVKEYFTPKEKIEYYEKEKDIEIVVYPDNKFGIDVHIDFNSRVVGYQYATLNSIEDFDSEISACKTFVFLHELEALFQHNLIKGGDINNALVIVDKPMSKEKLDHLAELFNKPKMEVIPEGYLNNTELTFQNEPARHKLLDIVGDLSLTGVRLNAKIIARKPGHHANTELAKIIRKLVKQNRLKSKPPEYDPNKLPIYDINEIKKMLPHRPPFLLVDKITYMDEWVICGIKNVTMNESFFVGHFPSEPIMPGVLQIESMAQVGGILLLSRIPDPENYILYFMKLENIKFKHKVVPGDTLNIRMKLLGPLKHGVAITFGQVFVGDNLVVEGQFMAQLARKTDSD